VDIDQDRKHPVKSKRPIASGRIGTGAARITFVLVTVVALFSSFFINKLFAMTAVIYFVVQMGYSLRLKHVVIVDVFTIAAGFFLRVIAGAHAITVPVSSWLLVCTFFLSLFLALSKRRHEIVLLEAGSGAHRKVLEDYNTLLLDQMISVVTAGTVVAYSVYTLSEETITRFNTTNLIYTIPFVLFGIYRYLYIVYLKKEGGSPEIVLLSDRPLILNICFYIITVIVILYAGRVPL